MSFNYESVVNSFYLAYYGRPADPAGLQFWVRQLESVNGDFSVIVNGFSSSQEAADRFGADDAATRITSIYNQLFDRAPEQAGLDYWVAAIKNGHMTMGEAAIQILDGARGTDADLSHLRQQATAQFTAEVASTGSAYEGAAAIASARVLIQAVTLQSSPADVAAIAKSAAALADVASHTPAVYQALSAGADLGDLFSSTRGKAEPAGLMQALASIAKEAAGNPTTLDTLLQGGGMARVLDVMPADTKLNDVVGALGKGGLPAAVALVYPPDPAPVAGTLSFADLDGGSTMPVTNQPMPALKLQGNDQGTTVEYQISRDGNTWVKPQDIGTQADGAYYYRAVVSDAAGNSSISNVISDLLDRTAPAPVAVSVSGSDRQLALGEQLTVLVRFSEPVKIDPAAAPTLTLNDGGTASYERGAGSNVLVFSYTPAAGENVEQLKTATSGALHGTILDRAGNAAPTSAFNGLAPTSPVRVDTVAPQQTITVHTVDQKDGPSAEAGSAAPLMTNLQTTVLHASLSAPLGSDESVEYSLDNGATWQTTHLAVDGHQVTVSELAATASPTVTLRLSDAAGNHGTAVSQAIGYDGAAPVAGGFALVSITHGANDAAPADTLTNAATADVQFSFSGGLAAGDILQYSTDGTAWTAVTPDSTGSTVTIGGLDLTRGTPAADGSLSTTLFLRAADSAGNTTEATATTLFYDGHAEAPDVALVSDTGRSGSDRVTSVASLTVTGTETGAQVEYSLDGSTGWSATAPQAAEGPNTVYVRQVDIAGNVSAASAFSYTYDTQAPATPSLALANDSGSERNDRVTNDGMIEVGGLEHGNGTVWEYSTDGSTWQPGSPPNPLGYAVLYLTGEGPKSLNVHQTDLAGHTSAEATLSFTLDTTAPPTASFVQVEGASSGSPNVTTLYTADVSFKVDGALFETDTVLYRIGAAGWVATNGTNATIDAAAGTITINDVFLGASDPTVSILVSDRAGNETTASQKIDGPYQDLQYTASATAGGLQITSNAAANAYLGGSATALTSTLGGGVTAGTTTFGAQGAAFQGTLSVGPNPASALGDPGAVKYALGTNGAETLTGQYVWGFGGMDTLVGTGGNDVLYGGPAGGTTFNGGLGSDTFIMQGTGNVLNYATAAESHVVAGSGPASGFDTVYTPDLGFSPDYRKLAINIPMGYEGWTNEWNIAPANDSGDALLAAFNAALPQQFVNSAIMFRLSDDVHYLVATNGDAKLDSNDYVIKIVGKFYEYGVDFDYNTILVGLAY